MFVYGILKHFEIKGYQTFRFEVQSEIINRITQADTDCMEALLGGALTYYKFSDEEIKSITDKAAQKMKELEIPELKDTENKNQIFN